MRMMFLCLLNAALLASGQILFKIGVNGKRIDGFFSLVKLFFTPTVFCALCLYAFTTALWLYILNKMPISRAYPVQALAFPMVLLASMILFNEQVTVVRWVGIFLIIAGIGLATN